MRPSCSFSWGSFSLHFLKLCILFGIADGSSQKWIRTCGRAEFYILEDCKIYPDFTIGNVLDTCAV